MSNIIEFKRRENLSTLNVYEMDKFTITWEDYGLSYCGTIQTQFITDKLAQTGLCQNVKKNME